MTSPTTHTPPALDGFDPYAHAVGIADAYDEHHNGTPLTVLLDRADTIRDLAPTINAAYADYALGYASAAHAFAAAQAATHAAQAAVAHEDHEQQRSTTMDAAAHRHQAQCTHGHWMAHGADTCRCGAGPRPQLSLVKPQTIPTLQAVSPITAISTPPALPVRPRTDPATDGRLAFAQHAAVAATLPARTLGWALRPDGTAYQYLPDGTLLTHPGLDRAPITAYVHCMAGAVHVHLVTSPAALNTARTAAARCTSPHLLSRAYAVIPLSSETTP